MAQRQCSQWLKQEHLNQVDLAWDPHFIVGTTWDPPLLVMLFGQDLELF